MNYFDNHFIENNNISKRNSMILSIIGQFPYIRTTRNFEHCSSDCDKAFQFSNGGLRVVPRVHLDLVPRVDKVSRGIEVFFDYSRGNLVN